MTASKTTLPHQTSSAAKDPDTSSEVPWPTSGRPVPVPDTSMLPGSEKGPPAAVKLLNRAVQAAHDTIDQLADHATPVAKRLGEEVTSAGDMLREETAQIRKQGDAWVHGMRTRVRGNPLACVAAAVALGAIVVRLAR